MKLLLIPFIFLLSVVSQAEVSTNSGEYKYSWNSTEFSINDVEVHRVTEDKEFSSDEDPTCHGSDSYYPLSVVKNILSFNTRGMQYCHGMAHPHHWNSVHVVKLENGNSISVSLLEIFDADSIAKKILKDEWVKKNYKFNSVKDIIQNFEEKTDCSFKSFSFDHMKEDDVAVRLYCKTTPYSYITLGFYLTPNEEFLRYLHLANESKTLGANIKEHYK